MSNKNQLAQEEKVKFFRMRAEISQAELEEMANLGTGSVNKIESGVNKASQQSLMKIAIALNLSQKEIAYLLGINFYKVIAVEE